MKPAVFHPKARAVIRGFPIGVRREIGKAIFDLQNGHTIGMPMSRPMPTVAPGMAELRMKDRSGAFRVFYYVRIANAILIVHAFEKRTRATSGSDIQLGRRRLAEMLHGKE